MEMLIKNCKVVPAVIPTAGAVAALTPVEVDGRGFDRCLWVFATGAAAAGATYDAKIQDAATTGGALVDVTSAGLTQVLAASGASKVYAIDMPINSARPFMKITGAVGTDTFANAAVAILYEGSGTYPQSAPATEAVAL